MSPVRTPWLTGVCLVSKG